MPTNRSSQPGQCVPAMHGSDEELCELAVPIPAGRVDQVDNESIPSPLHSFLRFKFLGTNVHNVLALQDRPPLDYRPLQLTTWFLVCTLLFVTLCAASIITFKSLDHQRGGLFHFNGSYNYFLIHYLPVGIGIITTALWASIVSSMAQMTPYISMSRARKDNSRHKSRTMIGISYAAGSQPFHEAFENRHFMLNYLWLSDRCASNTIVPLKASFFVTVETGDHTRVYLPTVVAFLLLAVYGIIMIGAVWILIAIPKDTLGLKWNPSSLADQMKLFSGSNCLRHFRSTEAYSAQDMLVWIKNNTHPYRLGYWVKGQQVWYGIAEELDPFSQRAALQDQEDGSESIPPSPRSPQASLTPRPSNVTVANLDDQPDLTQSHPSRHQSRSQSQDLDNDGTASISTLPHANAPSHSLTPASEGRLSLTQLAVDPIDEDTAGVEQGYEQAQTQAMASLESARFRTGFWALRSIAVAIWSSIALGLIVLALIGYFKYKITTEGIYFNSTDWGKVYLYVNPLDVAFHIMPTLVFSLFATLWYTADSYYRMVQPFVGMLKPQPASENIWLEYSSMPPLVITWKAAQNGHFKVALVSLLSTLGVTATLLVAGAFSIVPFDHGYKVVAQRHQYLYSLSFLVVYLIACLVLCVTRKRYMPRSVWRLADVMSFCYESRLIRLKAFEDHGPDDEKEDLRARLRVTKGKYVFGWSVGVDGKRRLGLDVVERGDGGEVGQVEVLTPEPRVQSRILHIGNKSQAPCAV